MWRSSRSFYERPRMCFSKELPTRSFYFSSHLHVKYSKCSMSDRASKTLAEASLLGEPQTYDARSKRSGVPLSTLYHREHGRCSKEQKAESQQYLTASEEKALKTFLKLISDFGNPVRIKFLPSLALSIARQRSTTNKAIKPPGKNWANTLV